MGAFKDRIENNPRLAAYLEVLKEDDIDAKDHANVCAVKIEIGIAARRAADYFVYFKSRLPKEIKDDDERSVVIMLFAEQENKHIIEAVLPNLRAAFNVEYGGDLD